MYLLILQMLTVGHRVRKGIVVPAIGLCCSGMALGSLENHLDSILPVLKVIKGNGILAMRDAVEEAFSPVERLVAGTRFLETFFDFLPCEDVVSIPVAFVEDGFGTALFDEPVDDFLLVKIALALGLGFLLEIKSGDCGSDSEELHGVDCDFVN